MAGAGMENGSFRGKDRAELETKGWNASISVAEMCCM
jgi:hypothetical protein